MRRLSRSAGVMLLLVAGCVERPTEEQSPPPDTRGSRFDASTAGSVGGAVTWAGALPDVPPFTVWKLLGSKEQGRFLHDNPNAPAVDVQSRGFGGAVVYLRGVTPDDARPWDHLSVRVEIDTDRIRVRQGPTTGRVGFVRRGDSVEMCSTGAEFHSLRASGAAFFTLPFPDPDRPRTKRLDHVGLVELTSAAWWMRSYLFVDDHPYFAETDAGGRFELSRVPPGRYEIICWVANWNEAAHERDPETSRISRLTFRLPVEKVGTVEVRSGTSATVRFELRDGDFRR